MFPTVATVRYKYIMLTMDTRFPRFPRTAIFETARC